MIEIQCTSCHTRYRIDERVLPAESPTFKCSRCGHVFTTDPLVSKKITPDATLKPQATRPGSARAEPRRERVPSGPLKIPDDAPRSSPSQSLPLEETVPAPEAKPAPIKPYIRNQRPTMFDRTPASPAKSAPEPPEEPIDAAAVARMKASVEPPKSEPSKTGAPKPSGADDSPRASQPPPVAPAPRPPEKSSAPDEGDNLEFDFNDDADPELGAESSDDELPAAARWSVGDDAEETPPERPPSLGREPEPFGGATIPAYAGGQRVQRLPIPDEREFLERSELRSARSFIGLFFATAVVFVVLTFVIYAIPSASAALVRRMPVIGPEFVQPARLENQVSVSDVQANYQAIKGGHHALVLTGEVKNNSDLALHTIQVGVRLLDGTQHDLGGSAMYVGTTLSPRMITEMTPHELEFLQKLDPQKNFALEPGHAAPFLMVFIDPPAEVRHFAVAVSRAQPPALEPGAEAAAHS
jgi:predicted Zn finger-like uncharacterized protein